MSAYGLLLFVMPALPRLWVAFVPWVVGALFTAPLVLNPFYASFHPGSYAKHGPLRWLPVELTLVYDWPINTDSSRVMVWFGDHEDGKDPGFQLYFFDDNAYLPAENKTFWVKGESRAEFLIKTDKPISKAVLTLTAGRGADRRGDDRRPANAAGIAQSWRAAARVLQPRSRLPLSGHVAGLDGLGVE